MVNKVKIPAVEIVPIRIRDVWEPFAEYRVAKGNSASTISACKVVHKRLAEAAGYDTYLHEVTAAHITRIMAGIPGQGVKNNTISYLRGIWQWAAFSHHVTPHEAMWPLAGWTRKSYEVEQPPYVPGQEFGALLDAADKFHPVYRAQAALGLYLLARGPSEVGELRLWDLDPHNWRINVTRNKTRMAGDDIAVCGELRLELVRWLSYYDAWTRRMIGKGLQKDWYVIPRAKYSRNGADYYHPMPHLRRAKNTISDNATEVFKAYGSPIRGSHGYRKCGGRALYDELRASGQGRDMALDIVRSMYGHKSRAMTEHYLNLKMDRETRNAAVVQHGGFMYADNAPGANRPVDISTRQLPAGLTSGVLLGSATPRKLEEADSAVAELEAFRWAV